MNLSECKAVESSILEHKFRVHLRSRGVIKRDNPEKPLLSVIIVAENGKDLDRCIRSILIQPYDNLELIVLDADAQRSTESVARPYREAVDLWQRIDHEITEAAVRAGLSAERGSVVHVLYSADALAYNAYSAELIRKVAGNRVLYLLNYSIFRRNGKIESPVFLLFHPVLYRVLLIPKSIYDHSNFRSVNEFLGSLIQNKVNFRFSSLPTGVYLEESSLTSLADTAKHWTEGMPTEARKLLMSDLHNGCDSAVFGRIYPDKR